MAVLHSHHSTLEIGSQDTVSIQTLAVEMIGFIVMIVCCVAVMGCIYGLESLI